MWWFWQENRLLDRNHYRWFFTFPNEGVGDVVRIVNDLIANGYDGGISIEPHLAVVHHDKSIESSDEIMYENYLEYGRRMMKIIQDAKKAYKK